MLQLAYISSSRTLVDQPLIEDILAASRRNNQRDDVTGLLVAGGRRFLQVLEGPDQAVLAAYARIQQDDRHRALVLITTRMVQERAFGAWSMAYQRGGEAGADSRMEEAVTAMTANLDPNLRAQFTGFVKLHRAAA